MRKIYQSHLFDDKNAFRKSVYLYEKIIFQISAVGTGVCAYMDAAGRVVLTLPSFAVTLSDFLDKDLLSGVL